MSHASEGLIATLLGLPIFQAEWVLWLLLALSVATLAVMAERFVFYRRHRVDTEAIRAELSRLLARGDFDAAAEYLERFDSLQTNVVRFGLVEHQLGPESVQDLLEAAARKEQARYERNLALLATVASNAPFIGLFGTVLGIIRAFKDLAGNLGEASSSVMAGIAEALIATAIGLLVAIPAVVAFNLAKGTVKRLADDMHLLTGTLLANLKADGARVQPAAARSEEG